MISEVKRELMCK